MAIDSWKYTTPADAEGIHRDLEFVDDGDTGWCSYSDAQDSPWQRVTTSGVIGDPYVDPSTYEDQRAAEYPKIGDQLDAIWKQLNQDRLGGKALVQDAEDHLNAVLAVKSKYPKPK